MSLVMLVERIKHVFQEFNLMQFFAQGLFEAYLPSSSWIQRTSGTHTC